MRFIFPLLLLFVFESFGQSESSFSRLVEKGMLQAKELSKYYQSELCLSLSECYGKVIVAYYNPDTSKIILITGEVADYDATNNIRDDEHNKVNFITDHAFNDPQPKRHIIRTISAIYSSGLDSKKQWFSEVTDSITFFSERTLESITNYVAKQIPLFFIDAGKNNLSPSYWDMGRYAPCPDLKLHPDWDNYGKNVWKDREEKWRPYIGMPIIIRDYYLHKLSKRDY